MINKYGISEDHLNKIKEEYPDCVYCHKTMTKPRDGGCRKDWKIIEHLNHLPPWNNPDTVVMCCGSCNSSNG